MTRQEAIDAMTTEIAKGETLSAGIVNGMARIGVLKLDEPKSVEEKIKEVALRALGGQSKVCWNDIASELHRAGLRIVDACSQGDG